MNFEQAIQLANQYRNMAKEAKLLEEYKQFRDLSEFLRDTRENHNRNILPKIELVQQTGKDCVLACISMLSGVPLGNLHEDYPGYVDGMDAEDEQRVLSALGIHYNPSLLGKIFPDRVYLVSTQSLNIPFALHRIIIDTRIPTAFSSQELWWKHTLVFDPNKGVEGRKFYNSTDDINSCVSVVEVMI